MEKQTTDNTQMKGYDKTDRNFLATEQDVKQDKKEHGKLQPEKYPVNEESNKRGN